MALFARVNTQVFEPYESDMETQALEQQKKLGDIEYLFRNREHLIRICSTLIMNGESCG